MGDGLMGDEPNGDVPLDSGLFGNWTEALNDLPSFMEKMAEAFRSYYQQLLLQGFTAEQAFDLIKEAQRELIYNARIGATDVYSRQAVNVESTDEI